MSASKGSNGPLQQAALDYASRGWPVLPLWPRAKTPITPRGLHDATTDPDMIEAWWYANPDANIGLRTGVLFDVIDIDGPEGVSALAEHGGLPTGGPVSATGKGWHYLVQPTLCRNAAGVFPKVDFRGVNGYIVAPPSVHPKGHMYQWHEDHGPDRPLVAAPLWFLGLLTPQTDPTSRETIIFRHMNGKEEPLINPNTMLDILEVAGRIGLQVRKQGALWKALCIFHDEDTPSLTFYTTTPRQSFYCFGCHAWGDAVDLLHKTPAGYR